MTKVGVLGGGQLARMLALAGHPLGIELICYEPVQDVCANAVTTVIQGEFSDQARLIEFAQSVACVTLETENIPLSCAQLVSQHCDIMPGVEALRITQDRLFEKEFAQSLDIPTTTYCKVNAWDELKTALDKLHFPAILKTRKHGYDGKGQVLIKDWESAEQAWQQLQAHDLILEAFYPFEYEVSIISVRSKQGEIKFYPLVMNEHKDGILRVSKAPFQNAHLQQQAQDYAQRMLDKFSYVGVMTIEFFVANGHLVMNEIAPRVHNSGHWTIEGAVTSQFENHLRAITGLPLGETNAVDFSIMCNMIGVIPDIKKVLAIPGTHYHAYGKAARPLRKVGHITITDPDKTTLTTKLEQVYKLL